MITSSDHNVIYIKVGIEGTRHESEDPLRMKKDNLRKANWERLRERYLQQPRIEAGNSDDMATSLLSKIKRAMDASITKVRRNTMMKNKKWTARLAELSKTARSARNLYQRSLTADEKQQNLERCRTAKREYEVELWQEKSRTWQEFVDECLQTEIWETSYKLVTERVNSPTGLSTLRTCEGVITKNWRESIEVLMDSLLPSDAPLGESTTQEDMRIGMVREYGANHTSPPFEIEELLAAIDKMKKKRKTPGLDEVQAEVLHFLKNARRIQPVSETEVFNNLETSGPGDTITKVVTRTR